MRFVFMLMMLASPAAFAAGSCKYEAPRNLQLDLTGVHGVQIEVHSYDLHVNGTDSAKNLTMTGRACASDQATLANLQVTSHREGNQLMLDLGGENHFSMHFFGVTYADLNVTVQLPSNLPVTVNVGSGDASVSHLQQLQADVASGDLHVNQIDGKLSASVSSGDIGANNVGSLDVGSVSSGDFKAVAVKGDARIGSIGSGDVDLRTVGGSVRADTLGSGDLRVSDVGGDLSLGAKGSGDVSHSGIKGKVNLPRDDDD